MLDHLHYIHDLMLTYALTRRLDLTDTSIAAIAHLSLSLFCGSLLAHIGNRRSDLITHSLDGK
jgi:hypothetical protein